MKPHVQVLVLVSLKTEWLCSMLLVSSFEVFAFAYTQVGTNLQLVHSGVVVELVLTFSQYWWCGRDSYVDAKCLEKLFWVDGC